MSEPEILSWHYHAIQEILTDFTGEIQTDDTVSHYAKRLCSIHHKHCGRHAMKAVVLFANPTNNQGVSMSFVLPDNQQVIATVAFTDAENLPASLPAAVIPVWSVDDSTILSVTPSPDGLSAVIKAATPAKAGTGQVNVVATLPDGTTPSASGQVQIVGSEATVGALTFGTPAPVTP